MRRLRVETLASPSTSSALKATSRTCVSPRRFFLPAAGATAAHLGVVDELGVEVGEPGGVGVGRAGLVERRGLERVVVQGVAVGIGDPPGLVPAAGLGRQVVVDLGEVGDGSGCCRLGDLGDAGRSDDSSESSSVSGRWPAHRRLRRRCGRSADRWSRRRWCGGGGPCAAAGQTRGRRVRTSRPPRVRAGGSARP